MDLSKAFDCMLLVSKLETYGVQPKSSTFILSYPSNRKKLIRVAKKCSSWQTISKGVPQRYVLCPIHFNVFINDLFYFVKTVLLTNYADDNTNSNTNEKNLNCQIIPGKRNRKMYLVVCYKLHDSQPRQISVNGC